jgi:hypothetical protein
MSAYQQDLEELIRQLNVLLDDREPSPGFGNDYNSVGPIEKDFPELYAAIQKVETYTNGKLPMGAWEYWNVMLELSRTAGGDPERSRLIYVNGDKLLDWALEAQYSPSSKPEADISTTDSGPGFLSPEVDLVNRTVRRRENVAKFDNKTRAWLLFFYLQQAGEPGLSRDELREHIWGDQPVTDNSLDQTKKTANEVLVKIRIEIAADNRGIWRLTPLD